MRSRLILLLLPTLLMVGAASAEPVKITHGPVVEHADPTTAVIAWSTNESSATIVRFGTDPDHLTQIAQMPWGALTHRVMLKGLQPGTTYYFQADSSQGEGTGSAAVSQVGRLTTPPR